MIAGLDPLHAGSHLFDDAGALVAENHRQRMRHVAGDDVQIAVAHAARDVFDPHLVGPGRLHFDVFDGQRLPGFIQNGGFCLHVVPSLLWWSPDGRYAIGWLRENQAHPRREDSDTMRRALQRRRSRWAGLLLTLVLLPAAVRATESETYDQDTILEEIAGFFGESTKALGKVIAKAFQELGRPNGYIKGQELSGALAVGLRYGNGTLYLKRGKPVTVHWKGPSIGFDVGGNAAKVFVLVYNLRQVDDLFQRYPGVDGSFYYVAGVGMNYQRSGDTALAPIRLGVGLRAGAHVGYTHYTRKKSWVPF